MDDLKKIVSEAVWAPSGDNSQPWRFVIGELSVKIFNLPDRDNPILNFKKSGSYIAHGALIENITILAGEFGYTTDVRIFPDSSEENLVSEVIFTKSQVVRNPLRGYIKERHTNRRPYEERKIDAVTFGKLLESGTNQDDLIIVEEDSKLRKISSALSVMERIALENKGLHRLFFGDLLWSEDDNKVGKPGLFVKTLEIPVIALFLFKILRFWPWTRLANLFGFSRMASYGNAKIYARSSAFILVSTKGNLPVDFVNSGRLTQRIWLTAVAGGLSVQPVTGILFMGRRFMSGDTQGFSMRHVQMAKDAHNQVQREFGLPRDSNMMMVLRIGYAQDPTAHSFRMSPHFI
ncbi:nitroreductase family protein [Candidatus Nomurabacteria bacterium]|nr:nitroreductase family protein [Candidatus Nomurabacteria bacterium]